MNSPPGNHSVVFLHGLGTGPSGWRPQVDALAGTRAIFAPSLIPSYAGGWPAVVETAAQAVQDASAQNGPVDVCGLSLGAVLALHIAAASPHDVRRVVSCAGFLRLPIALRVVQRTLSVAMRGVPTRTLIGQITADVPPPYRKAAQAELAGLSARAVATLVRATAAIDIDAQAVAAPVLVLCGARDRANLPLSHVLAESLPDARLVVFADAGHVLNLDAPARVTAAITEFLDAS